MDVLEKLAATGQLNSEQVDRIGQNVASFVKQAAEDPELLKEALEVFGKPVAGLGGLALTLAAAAGINAAAGAGSDLYNYVKDSVGKAKNYKNMLDSNPQLAKADAKRVQQVFDTLHKFNPDYASDPLVAGQFVQNSIDMERMPIDQVNALVMSQKAIRDSARRPDNILQRAGGTLSAINASNTLFHNLTLPQPDESAEYLKNIRQQVDTLKTEDELDRILQQGAYKP